MDRVIVHRLEEGKVLADDGLMRVEAAALPPGGAMSHRRSPRSEEAFLFYEGKGVIRTADRSAPFEAPRQAFVSLGAAYEVANTGEGPLRFVRALFPPGPTDEGVAPDPPRRPGGVTVLPTGPGDRFPNSGLVRGGMFFLEAGRTAAYHSHDGASEIFIFLEGACEVKEEGEVRRVEKGDVVYTPPERKHQLTSLGTERLVCWLAVAPNVHPSHTFYKARPDGRWERVTPRLDGLPVAPPSF